VQCRAHAMLEASVRARSVGPSAGRPDHADLSRPACRVEWSVSRLRFGVAGLAFARQQRRRRSLLHCRHRPPRQRRDGERMSLPWRPRSGCASPTYGRPSRLGDLAQTRGRHGGRGKRERSEARRRWQRSVALPFNLGRFADAAEARALVRSSSTIRRMEPRAARHDVAPPPHSPHRRACARLRAGGPSPAAGRRHDWR
jgi:hypothetical protein